MILQILQFRFPLIVQSDRAEVEGGWEAAAKLRIGNAVSYTVLLISSKLSATNGCGSRRKARTVAAKGDAASLVPDSPLIAAAGEGRVIKQENA